MRIVDPKPCAPSAERNRQPILQALQTILSEDEAVFEFGSGTGQHACHFAAAMPQLTWQPSDLPDKLPGIQRWIDESGVTNILPPVALDLNSAVLPPFEASVCYSANTLHIVSWQLVQQLFESSSALLKPGGKLCVYGPFIFNGQHTSKGNRDFDQQLRSSDHNSGIRDVVELDKLADQTGFSQPSVIDMPANNHLLVWNKAER